MVYPQDIFFIIASLFLGLATIFICVIFFYWIKILKNISDFSSDFKKAGERFKEKVETIGRMVTTIITFVEKIGKSHFREKFKKSKKSKKS